MGDINVVLIDEFSERDLSVPRCQARPSAARPGYREDLLCSTVTSTTVEFAGTSVPVCRIHLAVYLRWGGAAEAMAAVRWGWVPHEAGAPLAEAS
jgi:hypothetical protein